MSDAVATPAAPAAEAPPSLATSTPAPDAPATDAAPKDGKSPKNRAERRAQMFAAIEAKKAGGAPSHAPTLTPESAAPATLADTPATPAAEPQRTATAPQAPIDTDAALAKAIEAATRAEREKYEARQAAKRAAEQARQESQRAAELEARIKAAEDAEKQRSADPFTRAVLEGKTYEQITREMVEGKLKPPTAEELAIESQKSEVQKLSEKLAALEAERQKEREQFERTQQEQREMAELQEKSTKLAAKLQEHAQHFPVLAAVPWGASQVLRMHKANPDKSIDDIARELESRASSDVMAVFSSESSLKALLANTEVRDRISKLLGVKQDQPAQQALTPQGTRTRNSPDAIPSSRASETVTKPKAEKPKSTRDRVRVGMAAVEARRRAPQG